MNACAADREIAALQTRANALVAPLSLKKPLLAAVATLAREEPSCQPPTPQPPTPQPPTPQAKNEHGNGHGHGNEGD